MNEVIEIKNLYKKFGDLVAVNNLGFKVKRGELFAFLGVNGAGKSTTINIMCGQLKKDGGSVKICGTDLDENEIAVKKSLGVVFQNSVLDKDLTVKDNLESRAALYGIFGEKFKNGSMSFLLFSILRTFYRERSANFRADREEE